MGKLSKLREMTTQRRSIPVEVALAASATGASHDSLGFQPQDPSPPASPALKARPMNYRGTPLFPTPNTGLLHVNRP